ncbi:hypothetical protein D9M70_318190 [compost metagenome]
MVLSWISAPPSMLALCPEKGRPCRPSPVIGVAVPPWMKSTPGNLAGILTAPG